MRIEIEGHKDYLRLMKYAGKKRNQVSSPMMTANEAIRIADYIDENLSKKESIFTRETLRLIVDKAWQEATESKNVPSTKWADQIIDSVLVQLS